MRKSLPLFPSLLLLLITACSTTPTPTEGTPETTEKVLTGSIEADGSSTVYPITEAVAEEFRLEAPEVKVTVGLAGTGGGFQKFCRGETDVNNASRPIKDSEITLCEEGGVEYVDFTVAYDGLAVLVNPENDWVDEITVEELKKIWEPTAQNTVMKWSDVREDWPEEELHLYGPGTASGTFDYFTEAIVGEAGSSRGDYTASEDDNVLVQGIANDPNALGFFGLAYYEENADKLKLVGVNNGEAAVLPSEETVKNGSYTPLSRPLFIYFNDLALKRTEAIAFGRFYLENAGVLAGEVGYIAMTDEEYATQMKKFEEFVSSLSSN